MTSSYLTVAADATAEVEDRGSRFLCTLRRVGDEDEARALVAALRREHTDARHHCSAFVLGPGGAVQRSSDDGEPAGTAGAPMLDVLRGAGVSDVATVVTRWFGGTLLGAGGLVRAYGDAVRAAVAEAGTLRRSLLTELALDLDHADAGRVEGELRGAWRDRPRRGVRRPGPAAARGSRVGRGARRRPGRRRDGWPRRARAGGGALGRRSGLRTDSALGAGRG